MAPQLLHEEGIETWNDFSNHTFIVFHVIGKNMHVLVPCVCLDVGLLGNWSYCIYNIIYDNKIYKISRVSEIYARCPQGERA